MESTAIRSLSDCSEICMSGLCPDKVLNPWSSFTTECMSRPWTPAGNGTALLQGTQSAGSIHAINIFYIRSVYSHCHVDLLKCTEQNINNQSLTTLCSRFLLCWGNQVMTKSGGHGHVICMGVFINSKMGWWPVLLIWLYKVWSLLKYSIVSECLYYMYVVLPIQNQHTGAMTREINITSMIRGHGKIPNGWPLNLTVDIDCLLYYLYYSNEAPGEHWSMGL